MAYEISITPECRGEITNASNALSGIADVNTDAEARMADAAIKQAKTLVKIVHDQRMSVTRQIDAAKKACIAKEGEICADINAQIERVSGLCAAYLSMRAAEQERARREAEAKLLAEQNAAAAEAALTGQAVMPVTSAPIPEEGAKPVAGVSSRTHWTFDIVDYASVPRAYCTPDPVLIREFMNNAKRNGARVEELSMPGVSFRAEIRV